MKKIFILPMLFSFTLICSCQKQDSVAEQQSAQRKVELDTREDALIEKVNALDEKVNALDERVKAFAENEKSRANVQMNAPDAQSQNGVRDEAQDKAERDAVIQQFSAQIRARSKVTAGDPAKQERPAPRQLGPEDLQRRWRSKLDRAKMSDKAVFPAAEAPSPTTSSVQDATSPTPSPAAESTSLPTSSPTPE